MTHPTPASRGDLARDLASLGVQPGDILFVHSSFKSLGPVEGGAEAVVRAFEDALGPDGLLLMPSFNLVERARRPAVWNVRETPSTVGYLTEFFRRMPGTVRSDHYSHSVAARGRGAEEFVSEHLRREGPASPWDLEPWGATYGRYSPMHKAYERGGKVLMLGVDYRSSTYVHFVESLWWARRRSADPAAGFESLDRVKLGGWWDGHGALRRGRVGQAECRLFSIRAYVDALFALVTAQPTEWKR